MRSGETVAGPKMYAAKGDSLPSTQGQSQQVGGLGRLAHKNPDAGIDWAHAWASLWQDKSSLTPDQKVLKLLGEEWCQKNGLFLSATEACDFTGSVEFCLQPYKLLHLSWPLAIWCMNLTFPFPLPSIPSCPYALLACVWVYFTLFKSFVCLSFTDFSMSPQQTGAK